jgi:hypothetical protein
MLAGTGRESPAKDVARAPAETAAGAGHILATVDTDERPGRTWLAWTGAASVTEFARQRESGQDMLAHAARVLGFALSSLMQDADSGRKRTLSDLLSRVQSLRHAEKPDAETYMLMADVVAALSRETSSDGASALLARNTSAFVAALKARLAANAMGPHPANDT